MIISFQELKSEEPVLNLVFCLNYFDYSQSVGKWSVGRSIDNDQAKSSRCFREKSYVTLATRGMSLLYCSIFFVPLFFLRLV